MEQYELLQDLPTINKGEIFEIRQNYNKDDEVFYDENDGNEYYFVIKKVKDFNKWFKKVKWKPKNGEKYCVIKFNDLTIIEDKFYEDISLIGSSVYSPFYQTYEEAEEKLNKIKDILNG